MSSVVGACEGGFYLCLQNPGHKMYLRLWSGRQVLKRVKNSFEWVQISALSLAEVGKYGKG